MFGVLKDIYRILCFLTIIVLLVACKSDNRTSYLNINGEAIYEDEVMLYLLQTYNDFEVLGGADVWDITDFSGGKSASDVAKQGALDNIIMNKVLIKKAQETGVSLSDEKVSEIEALAQSYFEELSLSFIEDYNITEETVQRVFLESELAKMMENQTRQNYQVTSEEINERMMENEEYLWLREAVNNGLEELLTQYALERVIIYTHTKDDDGNYIEKSQSEKDKALERMNEALEQIEAGADFSEVAMDYSDEDASVDEIFMVNVIRMQIPDKVAEVLDQLEEGETSEIIEGDIAYHLIHLVKKEEPSSEEIEQFRQSYENWQKDLADDARETIASEGFETLYNQWQQNSNIIVEDDWKSLDILKIGDYKAQ